MTVFGQSEISKFMETEVYYPANGCFSKPN